MKKQDNKELIGNKLILRKFKISDAKDMYDNWANDEDVTKYLTWKPHKDIEESREIISSWIKNYSKEDFYQWSICKLNDESIGSITLMNVDVSKKSAFVGYCIGRKYWNKGYTSEALKLILKYAFEEARFRTIYAKHDVRNINSGRVMKSAGMKYFKSQTNYSNNTKINTENYYKISSKDYVKIFD